MNIRKQSDSKKNKTQVPSCSNCFACRKGTEYCPLDPNYDPDKIWKDYGQKS